MFGVSTGISYLQALNLHMARQGFRNHGFLTGFLRYAIVNLILALISALLVVFFSPEAAGSGIPDVKAWLNGTHVPNLLKMKTFLVKLIGIIFSVSGSFVIGKEGPLVHSGAAIGSGISLGRNKTLGLEMPGGHSFRNDADGRDLISCGAAAGVAAAFGAPVGGMLFALEEVSSFWQPGLTWRAFFSAATSNLVLQLLLGCAEGHCGRVSKESLIDFESGSSQRITEGLFNYKQFVFFVLMGIIGGIFGALFNKINKEICLFRKHYINHSRFRRLVEVLLVSLLTSVLLIIPLVLFSCDENNHTDNHETTKDWNVNSGRFTCKKGSHNPLSSLTFGKSEDIIRLEC